MLNHGCGGAETLCLIKNRLDGVCQCPANMFKRVDQDQRTGQDITTCTSELHQCSCHTLTPSHLHTHTNPHLHSLVCLPSSTSRVTPSHSHPPSCILLHVYPHPPHTHHSLTFSPLTSSLSLAGADSLLLIATQEAIHYLPIHANISTGISRPLPIGPLYDVSAVAYDPVNKSVLWIDRETEFLNG